MSTVTKFRGLGWSEPTPPAKGEPSWYDHVVAVCSLGVFLIEWKGWKLYDGYSVNLNGNYIGTGTTLDEAKALAMEHVRNVVLNLIETDEETTDHGD